MEHESTTPQAKESTAYENYKGSFGCQVYVHRNERKMTPESLAAEVGGVMQKNNAVDKAQVIRWEQALAVPDREQYKALEKLLIDDNPAIKSADKLYFPQFPDGPLSKIPGKRGVLPNNAHFGGCRRARGIPPTLENPGKFAVRRQ